MTWIPVTKSLPKSGQRVLTIKIYLLESGWADPFIDIDQGWETYLDAFRWEKGGNTTHWMELPEMPIA